MRCFFCLVFLLKIIFAHSQRDNFFDIQQVETKLWNNFEKEINDSLKIVVDKSKLNYKKDSAQIVKIHNTISSRRFKKLKETRIELLKTLISVDLPDITFTDEKDKAYSLSDFSNQKIILNFNYSFCQECTNQIDSIIQFKPKNTKLIVLLSDSKTGASHILDKYGSDFLIGFISKENEQTYTLNCGTPFTYFLDESQKINYTNSWFYTENKLELINKLKSF